MFFFFLWAATRNAVQALFALFFTCCSSLGTTARKAGLYKCFSPAEPQAKAFSTRLSLILCHFGSRTSGLIFSNLEGPVVFTYSITATLSTYCMWESTRQHPRLPEHVRRATAPFQYTVHPHLTGAATGYLRSWLQQVLE
ncbi:hypothetical protein SKAU_G00003850 [Synaphobranchus kaupii]|uniref:Secreted protein n=1 Tax=Synaphobranchus kaupii TaxID=118154 RepID=A0A9Q1GAE1_SYNKA|nr:hypothetical protein SKAU_G00003850 [Synaphobranchus kaupii]